MAFKTFKRLLKFTIGYYKANRLQRIQYKAVILGMLAEKFGVGYLFYTDPLKLNFLDDPIMNRLLQKFDKISLQLSLDRKFVLSQLLKYTVHVEGDYIECGVFKGASAYVMAEFIKTKNIKNKFIHLVDSFEGLSEPIPEIDGTYWKAGHLRAPTIDPSLQQFDFVRVYKGWIPEVFNLLPSNIKLSFAHIDVDLYQPTKDSLLFVLSRIQKGGIILIDDYFFETCPGAKRAADEILGEENIVILPTGQGFYVKH